MKFPCLQVLAQGASIYWGKFLKKLESENLLCHEQRLGALKRRVCVWLLPGLPPRGTNWLRQKLDRRRPYSKWLAEKDLREQWFPDLQHQGRSAPWTVLDCSEKSLSCESSGVSERQDALNVCIWTETLEVPRPETEHPNQEFIGRRLCTCFSAEGGAFVG